MIKLIDLINKIEKKYPLDLAFDFDNVGLLIGDKNKKISKILVTLDVTQKVINQAIEKNIDLIISHHPIMFRPIKKITSDTLEGRKIISLIANNIALYSLHTNLDVAKDGLNEYILNLLGFDFEKNQELDAIRNVVLEKEILFDDILKILKNKLDLKHIRYIKTKDKIKEIYLVTGSGKSYLSQIPKGALLITGDLTHHESLDAKEEDISQIDIEHYGSEKLVKNLLYDVIKNINEDLEVYIADTEEVFEIYRGE